MDERGKVKISSSAKSRAPPLDGEKIKKNKKKEILLLRSKTIVDRRLGQWMGEEKEKFPLPRKSEHGQWTERRSQNFFFRENPSKDFSCYHLAIWTWSSSIPWDLGSYSSPAMVPLTVACADSKAPDFQPMSRPEISFLILFNRE